MSSRAIGLCCLTAIVFAAGAAATRTPFDIDPAKSTAHFRISHFVFQHVDGNVPISGGTVELAGDSPVPAKVSATLDASAITTGNPDRDRDLMGPDYFDAHAFPAWTFVSSAITPVNPRTFTMDGTLTIHGTAQPEHVTVTISGDPAHPHYEATGAIDRHAFGMKGSGALDSAIGTTAQITLDIALK